MEQGGAPWEDLPQPQKDALLARAAEAARMLTDPTHPEYAAARRRLAEIEAGIRAQMGPLEEAIAATERRHPDDWKITVRAA